MPAISPPADFRADSAVEPRGSGSYGATVSEAWSGPPGPNGGYIAALVLRAIRAEVADSARRPRSLTLHYLRPPGYGAAEITVEVERAGSGATTCTARLVQEAKLRTIALCTLAVDYEAAAEWASPPPPVPGPQEIEPLESRRMVPEIFHQHEFRPTFGDVPFTRSDSTVVGGWIRTRRPTPVDHELLALYSDVWWPAPFPRLDGPAMAPTIDLTIHFRADPPQGEHPQVLGRFSSTTSAGGFFEEDGELWAADGTLLVQSRQLALIRPIPTDAG